MAHKKKGARVGSFNSEKYARQSTNPNPGKKGQTTPTRGLSLVTTAGKSPPSHGSTSGLTWGKWWISW